MVWGVGGKMGIQFWFYCLLAVAIELAFWSLRFCKARIAGLVFSHSSVQLLSYSSDTTGRVVLQAGAANGAVSRTDPGPLHPGA